MKSSFEPIFNNKTEIFILGTLPGEKSLQEQRYYAHPQNTFWKILAHTFTPEFLTTDYELQKQLLLKYRIGLWDMVEKASRKGSLDSTMTNIQVNEVYALLKKLPHLRKVLFNGQKSFYLYKKQFEFIKNIDYQILPSTSPANAQWNFEQKLAIWKKFLI